MGILNRNGALFMATGIDNSGLYSGLRQSEARIEEFRTYAEKAGLAIGGYFGIQGLKSFGQEIISVRGEMQMLESSFEVLLGGKGVSGFLAELKQFAVDSPLSLSSVGDAAQMLLAFGVEADKVMGVVKQLGDISMGNTGKFQSLALAFSQMTSAGKVLSQDLRQMATAGFNPLGEIARTTGKSIQQVTEQMDKGQITVDMVANAFATATAEGGKFYGMTQKQAEGIKGLQAQLEGSLQDAFDDLGKSQEGLITGGYKVAISLVENYETIGKALTALIATYGVAKAAMVFDTAIDKTVKSARILEESKSLEKLISTEQKATISKLNLTKGTVEYATAVKSAALANVAAAKEQVSAMGKEASAQNAAMIAAKQRAVSASEIVAQRKAELAAIIGSAEAEKMASLQKKMAIESEKQSRVALRIVKLQEQKDAAIAQAQALKESVASEQKVIAKNREIASIHAKILAARAEEIEHGRAVASLRAETKAIVGNTATKQVNTAQKKLDSAVIRENTAVTEKNAAMKAFYSQKAKIQMASQTVATMATKADTAANAANVTTTNLLSIAKTKLTAIATRLNAVLAANKFTIIAAAAVALGYGIYKLATYTTEAEKATKEYNKSIESEKALLDVLIDRFNKTEKGSKEYEEAKKSLNNKYGEALTSINLEVDALHRNKTGYELLTAEIEKNTKAKIRNKYTEQFAEESGEEIGKTYSKIRNKILGQIKGDAGKEVFNSIKEIIENSDINTSGLDFSKQFKELGLNWSDYSKDVYSILSNQYNLKQKIAEIDDVFSYAEKTNKGDTFAEQNKEFDKYSELVEEATQKVANLKEQLKALRSDNSNQDKGTLAKAIEEKVKELKDAEDKLSSLTGQNKQTESAAEKARKQAQDIIDQEGKIKLLLDKQSLDRKRANEDLKNQETQASINAEKDKSEKVRRQRELDNKLEIQALERQKEDYIRTYIQYEREKFDANEELELKKDPKYKKEIFDPTKITVDTSRFDIIIEDIKTRQKNALLEGQTEAWNEYFIQFGSYQEKRKAIIEKYNREIAEAQEDGKKKQLEKERDNQLDELDNSIKGSTTLMGQLFADASQKSVNEIQAIIDKTELLMKYIEAIKDEQGNAIIGGKEVSKSDILGLGVSEHTLKNLELSTQEIESLRNAIQKLKGELGSKSPFLLLKSQITDAVEKIQQGGKKNIAQGITEIGTASSRFAPDIAQFGKELGNIVGNDDLGNKIAGIAEGIGGLGETAAGVGQIMSGDIVGGTMAAVSGISKVVSAVDGLFGADYSRYNKMKEEYEKLNSIWDELIDKKKEYIKTSFGPEAYKVGQEAEELTRKAIENYRILGRERLNAGSSAGSHSIGRRQWRDMSDEGWRQAQAALGSDWKKEYGDKSRMDWLFNLSAEQLSKLKEAGVFWAKLDDDVQGYLNSIIEGQERIEDINSAIQEQLTQVSFDSVRNSFVDTLLDMSSDAESFADDFTKYMQRAILNAQIADLMDDDLKKWYSDFADANNKKGGMSESDYRRLQNQWQGIVDKGLDMREKLKEAFNWDVEDDRTSTAKGVATASQDSVDYLNGMMTISVEHTRQILGFTSNIVEHLKQMNVSHKEILGVCNYILEHTRNIDNNTENMRDDISKMRKDIFTLTQGITLKK